MNTPLLDEWLVGDSWNCAVNVQPPSLLHNNSDILFEAISTDSGYTTSPPRRQNSLETIPLDRENIETFNRTEHKKSVSSAAKITTGVGNKERAQTQVGEDLEANKCHPIIDDWVNHQWPKPLPPKQLYGYRHEKPWNGLARILLGLALVGATIYSEYVLISIERSQAGYDTCQVSSASWFESRFFINVVATRGLSFTQAKLLDLAWDTFVGQGLRLLHAWWLYHVVTHVVTYLLETSSLPYDFLLNVLFSPASFSSLWSTLQLAFERGRLKGSFYLAWLVYAIGYILLFPTLWAASTGYASPSITAYNMSDQVYVPTASEDLRLCWYINDTRLEGLVNNTILGASFQESFGSPPDSVPSPKTQWLSYAAPSNFMDIFYYAKTKHSLQNYLTATNSFWGTISLEEEITSNVTNWRNPDIVITQYWDGLSFSNQTVNQSNSRQDWPMQDPPFVLEGSEFINTGLARNNNSYYQSSDTTYDTRYYRSNSVPRILRSPGFVPYNSTFRYGNKTVPLPAPFLNFGDGNKCSWWNSTTGECPCYMGKVLTADWAIADEFVCISSQGYVWGFSSFILLIAVMHEAVWVVGCWFIRVRTTINSKLIEYNRLGVGTARHILDLGEAIHRDLGPNTCIYTNTELMDALKQCPPVGYELERKGGIKRVGLVTVHHGDEWKTKIDLNFDDTYG